MPRPRYYPNRTPKQPSTPRQHEICMKSKSPWLSSFSSTKFLGDREGMSETLPWNWSKYIKKQIEEVKLLEPWPVFPLSCEMLLLWRSPPRTLNNAMAMCVQESLQRFWLGMKRAVCCFSLPYALDTGSGGWRAKRPVQGLLPFLFGVLPPDCCWLGSQRDVDMTRFYWVHSCQ